MPNLLFQWQMTELNKPFTLVEARMPELNEKAKEELSQAKTLLEAEDK